MMQTKPPDISLGRAPLAANSRLLRYLIAVVVVGLWWGVGRSLHMSTAAYQILGILFLVSFQWGVQRQPLRTLWVRSGSPLTYDIRFFVTWILFSLLPAYEAVRWLMHSQFMNALFAAVAIIGAFGLAYALHAMYAKTWRQLGLCVLTVTLIGIVPQLLLLLLTHVVHLHFVVGHGAKAASPSLMQSLGGGLQTFIIGLPLGFVIEEVFFRGALDTYLHYGESGTGWWSAIFVSALWGLWHLVPGPHIISSIVGLLVAQIAIGMPLSIWWRKSGNLVVNNTAHALLDAFRNGVAGAGIF